MEKTSYNGERLSDPGKLIRLTLRGHYVRWRLESQLAEKPPANWTAGTDSPQPARLS